MKFLFAILFFVITIVLARHAVAQQICAERIGVLKQLAKTHQEAPVALGITGSGQVVELLTSDKGTWTIIVTNPEGISCLIAVGESWENIERIAAGKPAA